jgi:hypothetical protein
VSVGERQLSVRPLIILTVRKLIPVGLLDATHIFDGLNEFPTHIAHMRLGTFVKKPRPWPNAVAEQSSDNVTGGLDQTLFKIALQWLREDREHRRELEKAGRKTRGARRGQVRTLFRTEFWGAGLMRLNGGRPIKLRGVLQKVRELDIHMCTGGLTEVSDTITVIEVMVGHRSTTCIVELSLDPFAYKSVANQNTNFN